MDSILKTSLFNFDSAAERLGLDDAVRRRVMGPKEKIEVAINPVLSDGKTANLRVFVVRHNDALGPAKGGIRMTPDVTLDDISGLSMEMTWKTSLIGVPFGGGKSGIPFDPASVSPDDKETIIRSFTRGVRRHIGPEIYVPAPDMGTNESDMAHIRDCIAYSAGTSITNGCFVDRQAGDTGWHRRAARGDRQRRRLRHPGAVREAGAGHHPNQSGRAGVRKRGFGCRRRDRSSRGQGGGSGRRGGRGDQYRRPGRGSPAGTLPSAGRPDRLPAGRGHQPGRRAGARLRHPHSGRRRLADYRAQRRGRPGPDRGRRGPTRRPRRRPTRS